MKQSTNSRLDYTKLNRLISWLKSERSRLEQEKNTYVSVDVLDINTKTMRGRIFYYVDLRVSKISLNYLERRYNPFLIREGRSYKLNYAMGSCTKCESATDFRMVFDKKPTFEIGGSYKLENIPPLDVIDREIKILDEMKDKESTLKDVLFGNYNLKNISSQISYIDPKLNERQEEAVLNAVNSSDFHLILGPPGTGKTTIISEMCKLFAQQGKKVLLTSWMNVAVDNALNSILKKGTIIPDKVCRLGAGDYKIAENILPITIPANSFVSHDLTHKIAIAGSTLASAHHTKGFTNTEAPFDVVIVDEAGASTVPETLLALTLGKKFILIGDHLQLPPIVGGDDTEEWIKESLFEKLWKMYPSNHTMLNTQYRMDKKIADIASKNIYDSLGGIITPKQLIQRKTPFDKLILKSYDEHEKTILDKKSPICWANVFGKIKWIDNGNSKSANNVREIENIAEMLDILINKANVPPESIGVLSPFRYQVSTMINALDEYVEKGVVINTIHSFQGDEKDIIFLSLVTDTPKKSRIYSDIRLMNVAITRSKFKLIIVGDPKMGSGKGSISRMLAGLDNEAVACNGVLKRNVLNPDINTETRSKVRMDQRWAREEKYLKRLKRDTYSRNRW
jgi:DNA replication ATP-dependent helicase Dna2